MTGLPTNVPPCLDVFIGRQPILDEEWHLFAYELLFRDSSTAGEARVVDGDHATSTVLANALFEIGLDRVVGEYPAFVNLTRGILLSGEILGLVPRERVVLEVLEDVPCDDEVLEALRRLRRAGYRIALDDFVYRESLRPMVELADFVKVDVRAMTRTEVEEHVNALDRYPVTFVAEKIETKDEFEWCRSLGFTLFQGRFLCYPEVLSGQRVPTSRLTLLRLLARLQDREVGLEEIAELITQDVSLSYRLVRIVNSTYYAPFSEVKSIAQAIMMLGIRKLRNLVTVISLAGFTDKPHELMVTAMLRARMCELLSAHCGLAGDTMFTVGLFSVLDVLLDMPMQEILERLSLSPAISAALVSREGQEGAILRSVCAYELGAWAEVEALGLPISDVTGAWLGAVDWTRETISALRS